jgi:VWFA-related protein
MLRILVARCLLAATIIAALPAATPWPAGAQQPEPALTINQVDASAYPEVRAVATVLDARGVPVSGLTAAQFQAFDDKTQLTVAGATAGQDSSLGLSVIIVIDVSGSMAGAPLAAAKQAATEFAAQLAPNDDAAVIAFNQQVTPVIGLTNDRQRLTAAIAGLQAGGGTALYEAAQTSAFLANAAASPRRAVVLLTDGENDAPGSQATPDGALTVATGAGVPIFTVGFGASPDAGYLQQLSTATQGQYRAATAGTVSSVYADLATLLRHQYVVTIQAPGVADGKDATLQLIAFVGTTPVAAVATYKRGVAPVVAATAQAAPAVRPPAVSAAGSGTDRTPALVVGALLVAALAAGALYAASRWYRRRRLQRAQLAVVAPNPRTAAAQGVPASAGGSALRSDPATGRLTLLGEPGGSVDLTATPVSIGSDAGCTVRLPLSAAVAPRHAMIWVKDQKIMLRHVGGPRRSTLAAGRPVDWVTLEDGEEFSVGPHRFRAERIGSVAPEARR